MKDEKIIARIIRNTNEECVIRTFNHWNIDVVDMRWFTSGNPTKKGLRVNMEELKILYKALGKIVGDENDSIGKMVEEEG